jgi:Zn-finger nucleic acid-binding protein
MQEVLDRGVEVDRCLDGHGVYFDRGEVGRFIKADVEGDIDAKLLAAANRQTTRSDQSCSGCQRPMLLFQSTMLAAHLCQYCGGTWVEGKYLPALDSLLALPARTEKERSDNERDAWVRASTEGGLGATFTADTAFDIGGDAVELAVDMGGSVLELLGGLIDGL